MLKHGDKIPNSKWYRAICPICRAELRVTETQLKLDCSDLCIDCSPPHKGVGTPDSGHNGLDDDTDAWKPSWKSS